MTGAGIDRSRLTAPRVVASPVPVADHGVMPGMSIGAMSDEFSEFAELEDWEFDETIQRAQQLLKSVAEEPAARGKVAAAERQNAVPRPHLDTAASPTPVSRTAATPRPLPTADVPVPGKSIWPWLFLTLGIGVFACGVALVGMSLARGSTPLWQLGLPLVLGGQLAVLLVVIWQLDVVWLSHRATFVALHAVDDQLRKLQRQSEQRTGSLDAKVYTHHQAETASPLALLRVLRAQLDDLSSQLEKHNDAA